MISWNALASRLLRLAHNARPGDLLSLTVPLPALPGGLPIPDEWFHWQRPDAGLTLIGMGAAFRIETSGSGRFATLAAGMAGLRAAWRHDDDGSGLPARAFSGFAFAPENLPQQGFPNACLIVPALLLREEDGRAWATFSCASAESGAALAGWQRWLKGEMNPKIGGRPRFYESGNRGLPPIALSRLPAPLSDLAFLARGRAALSAIERGELEKLVLTRSVHFRSDRDIAPGPLLTALAARNPSCAVWAAGHGDRVFLGASPERLLAVNGPLVGADAIAGTTWLAPADDNAPHSLPLSGGKNRHEHDLVVKSVVESLAPLCDEIAVPDAPEVVRLRDLQHLRRRIAGQRKSGIEAFDLLARLHPTPAVGGTPTPIALDWLAAHGDRRGAWYTGGIGWLADDGDADFAIALRCGLLSGRDIALFAGAGFVTGSDPRQEMAETEAKLSPMLSALRSDHAARNVEAAA